jgi:hypothetical protein
LSGKPIECREMLKHEPGMVEDDSYMAIPRLVETEPFPGCFPKDTPTSGWSHKTSKNPGLYAKTGMQDAPPAFRNIALPIGFRCAVRTAKTPLPCWECHCSLTLLTFACAVAEMFSLVQDRGVPPHRNPL